MSEFSASIRQGGAYQSRGAKIMELADRLRPVLTEWLRGGHDEYGMPFSNERIRGAALSMAQYLIKKREGAAA